MMTQKEIDTVNGMGWLVFALAGDLMSLGKGYSSTPKNKTELKKYINKFIDEYKRGG